jgi:transcriptional regulator
MYLPSHFEEKRPEVLFDLMAKHPLATLVHVDPGGLEANHLPLLHDPAPAPFGTLRGHVARANPLWKACVSGCEVLLVFQGTQTYITPSWYPAKREHGKVVPTWNYAVVHARGVARAIDDAAWLHRLVSALTARNEATRPQPWAVTDAPPDYVANQLRAVVGLEITVHSLVGKWKVSQNRREVDRAGVVEGLQARADPEAVAMAKMVAGAQRPEK